MPLFLKKKPVYLDYNATTPLNPKSIPQLKKALKIWGNPSSAHQKASESKHLVWDSREKIAKCIHSKPLEVIFTSGASEANNFAIRGIFERAGEDRNELIVSSVEHPSVLMVAEYLESKGVKVHKIPVSREGFLDEDYFDKCLSEKTLLVSIMAANNETGVIFPLPRLIEKAHSKGALFHSDMVQMLGKLPVDVQKLKLDMASFSAHKCYGLKGCGVLYCKKNTPLDPFIHGGPQERSRRAGTENLLGIASFGMIASYEKDFLKTNQHLLSLKEDMEKTILATLPDIELLGKKAERLPNTSSFCIKGVEGETLMMNLDLKGFFVSVGSACNSGKIESSSALSSMGLTEREAMSCIRVSLGCGTTKKNLDDFVKTLKSVVERLRSLES